ncbi:OmpA family protein [Roseomonas sp. OT10]|uniref:OmpA family protein n=1 Tax=Roseomonas cutis TaxID=2897332 RepID=UPI001E3E1411|nr:OmpA family protein [Roseomonas sp. OT10]UFN49167.1 OmpA family protein [Roseomonas sp. OT10]
MSLRKALLAATMLSLPLAAQAQPVTGLYIGAGAGANWLQSDSSGYAVNTPLAAVLGNATGLQNRTVKTTYDLGFGGVVALGYGFGNGVRVEVEGTYRQNDIDNVRAFGVPTYGVGGTARTYGAMANVLYDFVMPSFIPQFTPVVPYIGAGLGYLWHDYDDVTARFGSGTAGASRLKIDDREGQFGYQGIVGLAFPIQGVPGLALTAEYRYQGSLSSDLDANVTNVASGDVVSRSKVSVDNNNHSAFIGLRYAFNAPRPAPVPVAPAPAPAEAARTYLVFFDWDRADLTDRARQIIAEAAQNARRVSSTRIEVAGHADRSGSPQYNQRLSQRRAEAVAAELARNGISRSEMVIQAFGESRPLVPTADGVREPQNRRVEIVLR